MYAEIIVADVAKITNINTNRFNRNIFIHIARLEKVPFKIEKHIQLKNQQENHKSST